MAHHPLLLNHRVSIHDPAIHQVYIACNDDDDGIPPSYVDDACIARCQVRDEGVAFWGTTEEIANFAQLILDALQADVIGAFDD